MSNRSANVEARKSSPDACQVVSLDAYRSAVRAAAFMLGCMHDPPWLKVVKPKTLPNGGTQLLVVILYEDVMIRRCIPTSVDKIPVSVVVEGAATR